MRTILEVVARLRLYVEPGVRIYLGSGLQLSLIAGLSERGNLSLSEKAGAQKSSGPPRPSVIHCEQTTSAPPSHANSQKLNSRFREQGAPLPVPFV